MQTLGSFELTNCYTPVGMIDHREGDLAARAEPCGTCPWRKDVSPGRFEADAFRLLADTGYDQSARVFQCHASPDAAPRLCAGFLARGAEHNLAVRLAYFTGRLGPKDRSGGHQLYDDYRAMARANGLPSDDPALLPCRGSDATEQAARARFVRLSDEAKANPCGCWRYAPLDATFHCQSCDAEWLPEGRP